MAGASPEERVLAAFAAAGHAVEPVPALDRPGSPLPGGVRLFWHGTELVFRVMRSGEVVILLYRRGGAPGGLRNPFRAMVGFLAFLAERREALGLVRVFGKVDTSPYASDGGLGDERLQRFYTDFLGASLVGCDAIEGFSALDRQVYRLLGTRWVSLDLADFRPVAEVVRRREEAGRAPVSSGCG